MVWKQAIFFLFQPEFSNLVKVGFNYLFIRWFNEFNNNLYYIWIPIFRDEKKYNTHHKHTSSGLHF